MNHNITIPINKIKGLNVKFISNKYPINRTIKVNKQTYKPLCKYFFNSFLVGITKQHNNPSGKKPTIAAKTGFCKYVTIK